VGLEQEHSKRTHNFLYRNGEFDECGGASEKQTISSKIHKEQGSITEFMSLRTIVHRVFAVKRLPQVVFILPHRESSLMPGAGLLVRYHQLSSSTITEVLNPLKVHDSSRSSCSTSESFLSLSFLGAKRQFY
jgi:hypothetical protein